MELMNLKFWPCLGLETSLEGKHSGMIIPLRKEFQQSLSVKKRLTLVCEREKNPTVYWQIECPHGTEKKE